MGNKACLNDILYNLRQKWNRTLFLGNYYVIICTEIKKERKSNRLQRRKRNQCKGYKKNKSD